MERYVPFDVLEEHVNEGKIDGKKLVKSTSMSKYVESPIINLMKRLGITKVDAKILFLKKLTDPSVLRSMRQCADKVVKNNLYEYTRYGVHQRRLHEDITAEVYIDLKEFVHLVSRYCSAPKREPQGVYRSILDGDFSDVSFLGRVYMPFRKEKGDDKYIRLVEAPDSVPPEMLSIERGGETINATVYLSEGMPVRCRDIKMGQASVIMFQHFSPASYRFGRKFSSHCRVMRIPNHHYYGDGNVGSLILLDMLRNVHNSRLHNAHCYNLKFMPCLSDLLWGCSINPFQRGSVCSRYSQLIDCMVEKRECGDWIDVPWSTPQNECPDSFLYPHEFYGFRHVEQVPKLVLASPTSESAPAWENDHIEAGGIIDKGFVPLDDEADGFESEDSLF
jgi:hypothetical protein